MRIYSKVLPVVLAIFLLWTSLARTELKDAKFVPGKIRYIPENSDSWFTTYKMVDRAKPGEPIDITFFIIGEDAQSLAVIAKLIQKQKAGSPVRLMMDARGTKGLIRTLSGQDLVQELVNAGGQVRVFNPYIAKGLSLSRKAIISNHDKIMRVGNLFKTGGRNADHDYWLDEKDHPTSYTDAEVLIESKEIAEQASAAFDREWKSAKTLKIKKDIRNIKNRTAFLEAILAAVEFRMMEPNDAEVQKFVDFMPRSWRKYVKHLAQYRGMYSIDKHDLFPAGKTHDAEIMLLDNTSQFTNKKPDGGQQITEKFHELIGTSRNGDEIRIRNPYVVLTEGTEAKLQAASDRGVRIKLVTNGPTSTDSLATQAVIVHEWKDILAKIKNGTIHQATGIRKLHAKDAAFRLKGVWWGWVSSFNMDYMSDRINSEIGVLVKSNGFGLDVANEIERYMKEKTMQLSLDPYFGPEMIPGADKKMWLLKCVYWLVSKRFMESL